MTVVGPIIAAVDPAGLFADGTIIVQQD